MNAHMRNGTSLRAIHNKIRVVLEPGPSRPDRFWLGLPVLRLGLHLAQEDSCLADEVDGFLFFRILLMNTVFYFKLYY